MQSQRRPPYRPLGGSVMANREMQRAWEKFIQNRASYFGSQARHRNVADLQGRSGWPTYSVQADG